MKEREHEECGHEPLRSVLPAPALLEQAASLLRAVGDPARLAILLRLEDGERCVTELAAESGDGMSTVSQRLRLLRSERLVTTRRDGKHIYYRLADEHVSELIRNAMTHVAHD